MTGQNLPLILSPDSLFTTAQAVVGSDSYEAPASGLLLLFGGGALVIQFVVVALQIFCIVHLIRRGRDWWWLWVLFCFPGIGAVVYFFVEVYPELRGRPRGGRGSGRVAGSARKRIRILERELELIDTVDRRSQLAAAYLDAGDHARARKLFTECLQGMYADDPHMLYGLARAHFGCGNYREALDSVDRTFRDDMPDYLAERLLLKARALDELGDEGRAIEAYADCVRRPNGVEGRCRYALLLERCGRVEDATREFRRVISEARILGSACRRRDHEWIKIARERVK